MRANCHVVTSEINTALCRTQVKYPSDSLFFFNKKKKMSFTKEIFPEMEEDRRWREKQLDYV